MIKQWINSKEIAELLSIEPRSVRRRADKEKWLLPKKVKVQGGKENRYEIAKLPEDIQTAYAASIKITLTDLQSQLKPASMPSKKINLLGYSGRGAKTADIKTIENTPDKYLQIAASRYKILEAYLNSGLSASQFVTAYKNNVIVPEVKSELAEHGEISSQSSLYRWLARYEQHGLAGLAPQYAGKGAGASLPQEAKDRIEWLYLDSSQPNISVILELLEQYGIKAGEATVRRYINSLPDWIKAKHRKGRDYFKGKFSPYIIRNYTNYKPMEIICGDYMTQDIVCRKGDRVFRARLCAFEDMRSRAIVGWSLQETANSIGVIRALQTAFKDCGLPETIYVDNGKEFKNYLLCGDQWKAQKTKIDPELLDLDVGILAECGIKVIFCQAYNGQSKPIERFWRFFHDRFDRFEASYTGSSFADRPDEAKLFRSNVEAMKKEDVLLIPAFEEVEARIGRFIKWYNEQWNHSGQGMEGRTPAQVFKEYAAPRREIPDNLKKYLFTMRYIRTVQRNGVVLDDIIYQNSKFIEYNGKKVEVRRGLDDAGVVHIFSIPDRVYLFDAENIPNSGIAQEEIRRKGKALKEIKELEKKYNRKKAEYDKGVFKTPAEIYAEKNKTEKEQKRLNRKSLSHQAQIMPFKQKKQKRKIIGIFDAK